MFLICGVMSAQTIKIVGDTTSLKNLTWNQPVILLQFGGGTFDRTGGGLFQRIDSTIAEGTHAFDHPWQGSQWARLQYVGGALSAFRDITATSAEINGDITLANDEIIDNDTDGDLTFIYNEDDDSLAQFIIQSSIAGTVLEDNNILGLYFRANDGGSAMTEYASVVVTITDTSSSSEDATIKFYTMLAGTVTLGLTLTGTGATIVGALDVGGLSDLDDVDIDLSAALNIDGHMVDIGAGSYATADGDNDLGVAGDVEIDGALDLDGGLAYVTQSLVVYAVGGAPQVGTDGASITADDGDRHFSQIFVPYTTSVTGIFYLVGATGGTDSVVVELFNSAGTLVTGASSVSAGGFSSHIVGTSAQLQSVPFTGGAVSISPGVYYISAMFDGTTATYAAYEVPGSKFIADTDAGTAWTPASITPGTAYVDSEGIIGGIY